MCSSDLALGATERSLARSLKWTTVARLPPLHNLRERWLNDANDNSQEFLLAQSLAAMRARMAKETLWFRQHLEPLEMGAAKGHSWAHWEDQPTNDVAWHEGDLTGALNAILARRLVRIQQSGACGWPDWSPRPARLEDITAFIEGRVNEDLLADLIWGLSLIDWVAVSREEPAPEEQATVPFEAGIPGDEACRIAPSSFYALMRLCFRRSSENDDPIPLVPEILYRAITGDGKAASELAARRLRASGKAPLVKDLRVGGEIARRTAAAMLFPISPRDFRLLEHMILQP